jgi:predicted small lipoprotein YifL
LKSFKTILIFLSFLFSISACGYKAAPYYQEEAPASDENVKFIMQKKEFPNDNNVSCDSK